MTTRSPLTIWPMSRVTTRTEPEICIHKQFFRLRHFAGLLMTQIVGGAIAQLGERLNGIQEVSGSIPLGSTRPNDMNGKKPRFRGAFSLAARHWRIVISM